MRNHYLDALKLLFIVIISFWHAAWWESLHHGYLPVEFFFIVSGYFIYRSSLKRINFGQFIKNKFTRLYPTYLCALSVFVVLFLLAPQFYPDSQNANFLISVLRDLLMMRATGIFGNLDMELVTFNNHDWYVSSFFYGGIMIFLFCRTAKAGKYLLLASVFAFYAWLLLFADKSLNEYWGYEGVFYIPLWRGVAGMALGALLGIIYESKKMQNVLEKHNQVFNYIAIIGLFTSILCFFIETDLDWLAIICFSIVFLNVLSPDGLSAYFNKFKYARFVPDISLEILLIHKFTIILTAKVMFVAGLLDFTFIKCVVYVAITIFVALMLQKIIVPGVVKLYNHVIPINSLQLR